MKKVFVLSLLLFFSQCSRFGVEFEVHNNTVQTIDSLSISNGFSSIKILNLGKNETYFTFLDFKENRGENIKGDGSYIMRVYSSLKKKELGFGYFSNGIPLANNYQIFIEKDTILITESLK